MVNPHEAHSERYQSIAARWRMTTESGVIIHPMQAAVHAAGNLGCDVKAALTMLEQAEAQYQEGAYDQLMVTGARINQVLTLAIENVRQGEPAAWDAYRSTLPFVRRSRQEAVAPSAYDDQVKGAWLGKCVGTALGDPVEGWTRQAILTQHGWIDRYLVPPKTENDDTAYPILVLHALDEYGCAFTSEDLALEWVAHLPYAYTAEQCALDNIKAGLMPPESRWRGNPCGAWVGAQMRGEVHGLIAPLMPEVAAELAFRDAIVSHYREGLDGEIYAAVLISLAFQGLPMEELLRQALNYVPADSAVVRTVEQAMDWCRTYGEWTAVARRIEEELGHYHWIHTLPNLACVICGLLLGQGDFERTILTTLACGHDTDCSAGQAGALVGALLGANRLPEKWIAPIGKALDTYVIGFERIEIDTLADWTTAWGRRILETCAVTPNQLTAQGDNS
jgi:ADP-ribosylglycohydrolase